MESTNTDEPGTNPTTAQPTPPLTTSREANQGPEEPTQLLGNKRILDSKGGDAGCLYKLPYVMPTVFFVRASCTARANSTMPHPEMQKFQQGMKQFFVTTGIGLAYHNDFDVQIYNIQKPTKEAVLHDFTLDYFNKVIEQRKI